MKRWSVVLYLAKCVGFGYVSLYKVNPHDFSHHISDIYQSNQMEIADVIVNQGKNRPLIHRATVTNLAKICWARFQKIVPHAAIGCPSPIQIHK